MSSKNATDTDKKGSPKGKHAWSIAARLTAWYALSSFAIVATASALLYWALQSNLLREDDEFLRSKVRIIREILLDRSEHAEELRWEIKNVERAPHLETQVFLRLLDESGEVMMATPGLAERLAPEAFPPPVPAELDPPRGTDVYSQAGDRYRVVAAEAAVGPDGEQRRVIQVALVEVNEDALLADYRKRLWLVLGSAGLLCAAVGYQIARKGVQPVNDITVAARRIHSATLHERIDVNGLPAEVHHLAATFNEMLDRLQDSFTRLSRFSADIAHELRTPIHNMRGEAEVALGQARTPEEYRSVLASSLEENGRISRMIDSLLFLARAEHPETAIARERLDLRAELTTIQEFYHAPAEEAGVAIHVNAPDGCLADFDRTLFQRAMGNLLENALAHTPAGGSVTLGAARENGAIHIEVADNGRGIPAEHLPHVFDRFHRADAARTGNAFGSVGLGLAIVKSIAALHGGSIHITSQEGRGTHVTLVFPGRQAAS